MSRHFAGYASVALETIWLHEPCDLIFLGPLMTLLCLSRYSSLYHSQMHICLCFKPGKSSHASAARCSTRTHRLVNSPGSASLSVGMEPSACKVADITAGPPCTWNSQLSSPVKLAAPTNKQNIIIRSLQYSIDDRRQARQDLLYIAFIHLHALLQKCRLMEWIVCIG